MTLLMRVMHRTGYTYTGGVVASYNEARMTPITTPEQYVLHTRLDVTPTPWTYTYPDYWGTQVTAFEVHELHSELTVSSTSTVDVARLPQSPPGVGWDSLADPRLLDELCEYLALTRSVAPPPDLVARVDELAGAAAAPGPLARQVCELVYDNVKYVPGSTDLTTTAEQAWESRKGVCQDMAHLSIGALRRAGVPARYVSGYLHPRKEPEVGEAVAGESHAWVEWWDGEWVGFDPTNNVEPGNRHIVVGRGREYRDVAPLRGIFSGGETSKMDAAVTITRVR